MKKYKDYDIIKKHDIQEYRGLENEILTHLTHPRTTALFPLNVSCFGITYPSKDYYIKRFPVRGYVLEYVTSGKGYIVVNGKKELVQGGDTYLLKQGENCEYFADPFDPFEKMWINFYGEFPQHIISAFQIRETVYKNVDMAPFFHKLFKLEKISTDFTEIKFETATIINEMLMALAKSIETKKYISEISNVIRQELHYAIMKEFNLEELSKKLFLSKSEIIRHFKNAFHITPYQYLLNIKINYAKSMIENNNASVKEIAETLCFSSPYHFSDVFKQKVGISPSAYKKIANETNKH